MTQLPQACAPDTILLLDISGSMIDSGYKELKNAAMDFVNSECHQILLPNCFNKRQTFIGIEGHSINLIESKVQYTPSVSTIILSGPTYSSQNVRQMSDKFESQHFLSLTIGCRSVALSCPFYLVKDCYFSELELYQSNSVQSGYQCHHVIKKLLVLAMV